MGMTSRNSSTSSRKSFFGSIGEENYKYKEIRETYKILSDNPSLPLQKTLTILDNQVSPQVFAALQKAGVKTYKDLSSLSRSDWVNIEADKNSLHKLAYRVRFVENFNRFQQQNKTFYNFVFFTNRFVFLTVMTLVVSLFCFFLTFGVQRPKFIKAEKEDESFIFKELTQSDFPMVLFVRVKGPYFSNRSLTSAIPWKQLSGTLDSKSECKAFETYNGKKLVPCGRFSYAHYFAEFKIGLNPGKSTLVESDVYPPETLLLVNANVDKAERSKTILRFNPRLKTEPKAIDAASIKSPIFLSSLSYSSNKFSFFPIKQIKTVEKLGEETVELSVTFAKDNFPLDLLKGEKEIYAYVKKSGSRKRILLEILHLSIISFCMVSLLVLPFLEILLQHQKHK